MADDQVVRLLEEIRDLQKQQIENSKQALAGQQLALANQQKAIETQKQVLKRSKIVLIAVGLVVAVLFLFPMFWWGLSWTSRCLLRR